MLDTTCPQCGAALRFRSADLAVRVCAYCRSTIVRRGEALEDVGRAADLPEDVSPLQLGVRGRDGEQAFELVGRVRWRWSDGAWNEWCALYADGSYGWLGEASGRLMLLRRTREVAGAAVDNLLAGRPITPGLEALIDGDPFTVVDVREVACVGAEGELPDPTPVGTAGVSVDLQRPDGRTATLQEEGGTVSAYAGRYVTLAEIAATGLREFEGWPLPRFAA